MTPLFINVPYPLNDLNTVESIGSVDLNPSHFFATGIAWCNAVKLYVLVAVATVILSLGLKGPITNEL